MCCASNVKVKTVGRAREGGPAGRWREPKARSRAPARRGVPALRPEACRAAHAAAALSAGDSLVLPLLWPPRRTGLRLPVAVPEVTDGAGPRPALTVHSHWPLDDLHAPLLVPWRPPAPRRPASACWRSRASSATLGSGGRCPGAGAAEFRVWGRGARGASSGDGHRVRPAPRAADAQGARSAQPADARLPLPGHAHPAPEGVQPPRRHDQQRRHPVLHHGACPRRVAPSGARAVLRPLPGTLALPGPRGPAGPPRPAARWPLCAASSLPASAPPLGALSAWGIPEKPSTLTTC